MLILSYLQNYPIAIFQNEIAHVRILRLWTGTIIKMSIIYPGPLPKKPSGLESIITRLQRTISSRKKRRRWAMVIVNPAAGQASPDLRLINRTFRDAGYYWKVEITNQFGDGARFARHAVRGGACMVVTYGGDGTVMDCCAGLAGSDVPLAILPGGTGNVLAKDLGIPVDMASACALLVDPTAQTRLIDLGQVNGQYFVLRLGAGLEAQITRTADREMKARMGMLAYVSATIQAWGQAEVSHYHIEMDGNKFEVDGLACMIANAGAIGIMGVNISPAVRIDDGLLDVIVIRRADLGEVAALAGSMIGSSAFNIPTLPHWQCRELRLFSDPPQDYQADGEELGRTPLRACVVPGALRVLVPGTSMPVR
jgi:YegS/Rv2252/BmrU family lipid kinase